MTSLASDSTPPTLLPPSTDSPPAAETEALVSQTPTSQPALPFELLVEILSYLNQEDDIPTLLNVRLASIAFDELARTPQLWAHRVPARWKRAPPFDPAVMSSVAFALYSTRAQVDRVVEQHVSKMTTSVAGMLGPMSQLRHLGEAALDELLRLAATTAEHDPQFWLARRYWAKEAWGVILRSKAREVWRRIADENAGGWEDADSFEEGVMAFSAFKGVDKAMLRERYTAVMPRMIESCTPALEITDRFEKLSFIAKAITRTMASIGIRPARDAEYHRLDNHFLDSVWDRTDTDDPTSTVGTLPMSLVSIFCSIVARLSEDSFGIQARPVGFPGTLLAALAVADEQEGKEKWVYVNVYDGGKVLSESDLQGMLRGLGVPEDSQWRKPRPGHAAEMCNRVAQNIIHSIHVDNAQPDMMAAVLYAASSASYILSSTMKVTFANRLVSLVQSQYLHDVGMLENLAVEVYQNNLSKMNEVLDLCTSIRHEDASQPEQKERPRVIIWKCGHAFVHRLFGYAAVIRGWDETCRASEQWIQQMRVDTLPYGRTQPFYHVLCEDGSRRYVASENVTTFIDTERFETLRDLPDIGLYFRTTEVDEMGRPRFVMGPRLEAEYKDG